MSSILITHPAATAPPGPACESCERQPATHTLTWPDRRFLLCDSCIPAELVRLAEPLDADDLALLDAIDVEAIEITDVTTGGKVVRTDA